MEREASRSPAPTPGLHPSHSRPSSSQSPDVRPLAPPPWPRPPEPPRGRATHPLTPALPLPQLSHLKAEISSEKRNLMQFHLFIKNESVTTLFAGWPPWRPLHLRAPFLKSPTLRNTASDHQKSRRCIEGTGHFVGGCITQAWPIRITTSGATCG